MRLEDMDSLVGKYVSISYGNNEGMDGWVDRVDPIDGIYRNITLDYGYGYRATEGTDIKVVDPPVSDPGPFKG